MNTPPEHYIIIASAEAGLFEPGLFSGHAKEYCETAFNIAIEHIRYFRNFDVTSALHYPNPILCNDPQYIRSKFVWLVGKEADPEKIIRDIGYLTSILLDFSTEFHRVPELRGVSVHHYTVFFRVI